MATTTKEKIEIMQAYERGEQIELKRNGGKWHDALIPTWDWVNFDYRVKSKFHDGDILFLEDTHSWIFIYKENENKEFIYQYVAVPARTINSIFINDSPLCFKEDDSKIRLATEEEKQKLFDCIKANGFHWNDETKTLEILIKQKFKAGDRIRHKLNGNTYKVSSFLSNGCGGGVYNLVVTNEIGKCIDIKEQDNYELLPNKFDNNELKPFDKVLVRDEDGQKWMCDIFSYYDDENPRFPFWGVGKSNSKQCIPYKGNEHLLGTTKDCDDFYKNWE